MTIQLNDGFVQSVLAIAACGDDPEGRRWAASHPALPQALAERLSGDADRSVRVAIAGRSDLTPELVGLIRTDPAVEVASALEARMSRPAAAPELTVGAAIMLVRIFTAEILRPLMEDEVDPHTWIDLAHWEDLPGEFVRRLAGFPDVPVRVAIAEREHLEFDVGALLIDDPDEQVRRAMAYRPRMPVEWAQRLASDPDEQVRVIIARHPDLPASSAQRLVEDASGGVRAALAQRADLAPAAKKRLARDDEWHVRYAVAGQEFLAKSMIEDFALDPHWCVRCRIAGRPGLWPAIEMVLSRDQDVSVRAIRSKP